MALSAGTHLGPYEILSPLGAGGMGEVYRAHDTKLNRDVAIKVLLPAVANDSDRLARFSREAQVLASLNHPNIAAIYGLDDGGDVRALVMELVEGPTLADRIARGAMALDQALPIARQIADALEAAHEQGIIHRDLKPANIKVRDDGTVKVLDFGLAKAMEPPVASSANAMNSPTVTAASMPGMILGTAAYMSPEQARGKPVDKRADIWAFGCLLFEMLTGRRAFSGETSSDSIAAILEREPEWTRLPAALAPSIDRLLRRCLDKDTKRRLRDIADARIEIDDALRGDRTSTRRPWTGRQVAAGVTGLVAAGVLATFVVGRIRTPDRGAQPAVNASSGAGPFRLVVLPFENLSRQPGDEWLAGAFSDSLTLGLRDVENVVLVNRERPLDQNHSTPDPQQVARALGVRYYVSGSYQRVGDDLKVVARLVEVAAGTITLQESFTDRFANLLHMEDDLAQRFAAALHQSPATTAREQTSSLTAYQAVAQANDFYLAGRYREAIPRLQNAVALDTRYADAWALLGKSYARLSSTGSIDSGARADYLREALRASRRAIELAPALYDAQVALAATYQQLEQVESWRIAAQKAIELNPRLPEGYVILGDSYGPSPAYGCARQRDTELAERSYRKALQLNPSFANAYDRLTTTLVWSGREAEGLRTADDALRLAPDNVPLQRTRATSLLWLGRADALEQQLRTLATIATPSIQDEWELVVVSLLRGHVEDAAKGFASAIERGPRIVREIDTARVYANAGHMNEAAMHLERTFALDPSCGPFIAENRAFAAYTNDPVLRALLAKYPRKGSS